MHTVPCFPSRFSYVFMHGTAHLSSYGRMFGIHVADIGLRVERLHGQILLV